MKNWNYIAMFVVGLALVRIFAGLSSLNIVLLVFACAWLVKINKLRRDK